MLPWRDEQELVRVLKPVMTKAGFKRYESCWYRFGQEAIQVLDLQPSTSKTGKKVYLNLGASFRSVQRTTHFRLFDCAVYGRMDRIVPAEEGYSTATDFSNNTLDLRARCARVKDLIEKHALPFLDKLTTRSSIQAFADSELSIGFTKNRRKFPKTPGSPANL